MKNLQLSLITKWFIMTESLIKKEDYRNVTPLYCCRFLLENGIKRKSFYWACKYFLSETKASELIINNLNKGVIEFIKFDENIMTRGYPSSNDLDKVVRLKHAGIEIRTGNIEWGSEPGEIYFVIKHGNKL